jgi:hypothetical protein
MLVLGSCGIVATLLLPSPGWADIGEKWWGDVVREPRGLKEIEITHEKLTIDLRPLRDVQPVHVEMIYYLNNHRACKKLDLVFVSGVDGVDDFEVRLDGHLVDSKPIPAEEQAELLDQMPDSWKVPDHLPRFEKGPYHSRARFHREPALLTFSLELPAGVSTITARYRARAVGVDEDRPTATWQFPYILAPAREWGGFGGLDVTVYVPAGWQSASSPKLEREGDLLRGRFSALPSDYLAIATRAPVRRELRVTLLAIAGGLPVVTLGIGFLCWRTGWRQGRSLARRLPPGTKGWGGYGYRVALLAIVAPILSVAVMCGASWLAYRGVYWTMAGQESPYFHEHYGEMCEAFLLIILVFPLGIALSTLGAYQARRRTGNQDATASGAHASPPADLESPAAPRSA